MCCHPMQRVQIAISRANDYRSIRMERSTQMLQYCCHLEEQHGTIYRLLIRVRAQCILPFSCKLKLIVKELRRRKYLELAQAVLVRLTALLLGTLGFGLPLYIFFCYWGVTMVLPILALTAQTTLKISQVTARGSTIISFPAKQIWFAR